MTACLRRLLTGALIGALTGLVLGAATFRLPDTALLPRTLHSFATPLTLLFPGNNADQDFAALAVPTIIALLGANRGTAPRAGDSTRKRTSGTLMSCVAF